MFNFGLLKMKDMRKVLALAVIGMLFSLVIASCGSSKGGNCDAYGSVEQTENSDLASK